jgi:hypothetical protein
MKISTVACLTVAIACSIAPSVRSEEPEQLNRPEAISVPVETVVSIDADFEKSIAPQTDNTKIHLDDNNRLVGLSN